MPLSARASHVTISGASSRSGSIGCMPTPTGPNSARWWRLPLAGWGYVSVVAALATWSVLASSDAFNAVWTALFVVTLPLAVAAYMAIFLLITYSVGLLGMDPIGSTPPLFGAVVVAVWTLTGWANAKLVHVGWRCACGWLIARRTRRQAA
jgi:hypothetical protein